MATTSNYGCVRKTAYKWLDIRARAAQILATIRLDVDGVPATFDLDPLAIKYFTAAILKNFARHEDSVPSQAGVSPGLAWPPGSRREPDRRLLCRGAGASASPYQRAARAGLQTRGHLIQALVDFDLCACQS